MGCSSASILCCIAVVLLIGLPAVSAGHHNSALRQPEQLAASARETTGGDRRLMSRTEMLVLQKKLELKLLKEKLQQKIAARGGAGAAPPAPVSVNVSTRIQSFVIVTSERTGPFTHCISPACSLLRWLPITTWGGGTER
jgi:hypothetical protein